MSPSLAALSAADGADFPGLPSGARLVVKRWGRGLPVPCLNASGHGSGDFVGLAERLDSDFEPIAVDQPGMNWSPPDRSAGLAPGKAGGLAPLDGAARFVIGHMRPSSARANAARFGSSRPSPRTAASWCCLGGLRVRIARVLLRLGATLPLCWPMHGRASGGLSGPSGPSLQGLPCLSGSTWRAPKRRSRTCRYTGLPCFNADTALSERTQGRSSQPSELLSSMCNPGG
jgi:hypothetical protein